MGILITGIRIWCAFICSTVLLLLSPITFVLESVAVFVVIFFEAIFKDDIKKSWTSSYPYIQKKIFKSLVKLWDWGLRELNGISVGKIIFSAMFGILALGLPLLVITIGVIEFWETIKKIILFIALFLVISYIFK